MLTERELGEFKKGLLDMLVLYILHEKDMYTYQLAQEIGERSHGDFLVPSTSLYGVLYRFEKAGYVSKNTESNSARPRTYYHLEPSGEELLAELLDAYCILHRGIKHIIGDDLFSE